MSKLCYYMSFVVLNVWLETHNILLSTVISVV